MGTISNILRTYLQRNGFAGVPLSEVSPQDALIYTTVRPNIKTTPPRKSLLTSDFYVVLADASSTFRSIPAGISEIFGRSMGKSGAPLVGLTSVLYCLIGAGQARDSYKVMKDLEKIGDASGANAARAQIVSNIFLASSSAAAAIVRIFGAVQELFELLKSPLVVSSALLTVKAVAVWASTALLVLFYAIYAGLQGVVLYNLSKGNELREKLTNSKDPVEALRQHIDWEMFKGSGFTKEECIEMTLQEGAGWLEKLEKEVKEFPWDPTDKSRREHVYVLFRDIPEFMMAEMGKPLGYDKLTPEGKMVRFGRFIGQKRLAAKIEIDLKNQLGPDAMEAFNKKLQMQMSLSKL